VMVVPPPALVVVGRLETTAVVASSVRPACFVVVSHGL
jgi:hypothetical protein